MLYISRRINESVLIDGKIEIIISQISGKQVKIGISAPKNTTVYRKELLEKILTENKSAYESVKNILINDEGKMDSILYEKINELNSSVHHATQLIKKGETININNIFKIMTEIEPLISNNNSKEVNDLLIIVLGNYQILLEEIEKKHKNLEEEIEKITNNLKAIKVYKNAN